MNKGARKPQKCLCGKKFCDGECRVTRSVVMMEHPFVCNVWSHANDPFSEPFKEVFVKNLVDSLCWKNKFRVKCDGHTG